MTANLAHHEQNSEGGPSPSDDPAPSALTLTLEGARASASSGSAPRAELSATAEHVHAYPPPAHFSGYRFCPLCAHGLTEQLVCERFRLACSSPSCRFVHWDNPKPAAICLVETAEGIVLTKRAQPPLVGTWCLPGGFIEAHEDAELAAVREVYEETGLVVAIVRLLAVYSPIQGANEIILVYHARPIHGDGGGQLLAGEEVQAVGVFAACDLPTDIGFPQHAEIINNWFKGSVTALPVTP
ncbi:NUDIX domain-containing protein [bacterium]|nr:NUDIX domain-containing protein [bacterium]